MFSGPFDQHVIQAADPFIVVEGEQVSGSFSTLEAAEEFIARQGRYSALVLRHDGQKWVVAADRPAKLFPHVFPAGLSDAHGIQRPGIAEATLISHIQKTLQGYPHIAYTADAHYLEVPAQTRNGFKVWIRQRSGCSIVGFESWHEEFRNAAAAVDAFMFGLTPTCRLRVLSCGGRDYKWQVQRRLGAQWITVSESGMVFFPFWCKRTERVLQNDMIHAT
jgi:hypothetical protein